MNYIKKKFSKLFNKYLSKRDYNILFSPYENTKKDFYYGSLLTRKILLEWNDPNSLPKELYFVPLLLKLGNDPNDPTKIKYSVGYYNGAYWEDHCDLGFVEVLGYRRIINLDQDELIQIRKFDNCDKIY